MNVLVACEFRGIVRDAAEQWSAWPPHTCPNRAHCRIDFRRAPKGVRACNQRRTLCKTYKPKKTHGR
jgi:hypothetical protein